MQAEQAQAEPQPVQAEPVQQAPVQAEPVQQEPQPVQAEQAPAVQQQQEPAPFMTVAALLKQINWQRFSNVCSSVGKELNDPQWRFLKAVFLENAVAAYSNGALVYVGETEKGCDFIIPSLNNTKIEMKYTAEALFGPTKTKLKDNCKAITLLNSKGTNTHTNLPEHYADYLLIVEMRGAAIISKENLKKYVVANGDSLSATIPTSEMTLLFGPSDLKPVEKHTLHIKSRLMSVIKEIIDMH